MQQTSMHRPMPLLLPRHGSPPQAPCTEHHHPPANTEATDFEHGQTIPRNARASYTVEVNLIFVADNGWFSYANLLTRFRSASGHPVGRRKMRHPNAVPTIPMILDSESDSCNEVRGLGVTNAHGLLGTSLHECRRIHARVFEAAMMEVQCRILFYGTPRYIGHHRQMDMHSCRY